MIGGDPFRQIDQEISVLAATAVTFPEIRTGDSVAVETVRRRMAHRPEGESAPAEAAVVMASLGGAEDYDIHGE